MKTSLLIMAAGIGSRFGGGIKQLEKVGPCGEIIMDYSIHDALAAGFDKIVFVIRRDIEKDFREIIGARIEKICAHRGVEVAYGFQELGDLPAGFSVPDGRSKPWGTGQAVLAARDAIREPFAVINADDYYGREAFLKLHEFLSVPRGGSEFAMAGFLLRNTLSDNGAVTRGVCRVDENGYLTEVVETSGIVKTVQDGRIGAETDGRPVDPDAYASMNFWGLTPAFMQTLEAGFTDFLNTEAKKNPLKAEYLIPVFIGQLLKAGKATVQVLDTRDAWFGVTYREDKPFVVDSFLALIDRGVYRTDLFSDL